MSARLRRKLNISREPKFFELKRLADDGSADAAFLLGIRYAGRIQFTGESWLQFDENNNADPKGVLETDCMAVKYFMQAAEAGCSHAMVSLSMKLSEGKGVQKNRIKSTKWAWKAVKLGEPGAGGVLDNQCMLSKDLMATINALDGALKTHAALVRRHGMRSGGPNLAALLLSRWTQNGLIKNNFKFPPLGGPGAGRIDVVGATNMRQILSRLQGTGLLDRFHFQYGRFGSNPNATAAAGGGSRRAVENQCLQLAKTPKLVDQEIMTAEGISESFENWTQMMTMIARFDPSVAALCPHMVRPDGTICEPAPAVCLKCVNTAKQRLEAAINGAFAIENNPQHTNSSVVYEYRGQRYNEEFKFYSGPEITCVLACLAADHDPPTLAHPCFIAQDPNLIWPTLLFYGSVRAALEHVAPKVDWVGSPMWHLGPSLPGTPKPPLVPGAKPGDIVYRCGSDICCNLYRKKLKSLCARCRRRFYCSTACQKADWAIHRRECVKNPNTSSASSVSNVSV